MNRKFKTVSVNIRVALAITPCSFVRKYQIFGEVSCMWKV